MTDHLWEELRKEVPPNIVLLPQFLAVLILAQPSGLTAPAFPLERIHPSQALGGVPGPHLRGLIPVYRSKTNF